jgi:hypothetical protein
MNTSTKTTRISAVFLAAVLVAGTIALSSPSFMNSAQAFPMDNNYQKKSFGKDTSVKYIKCNNINVNVNGFELNVGPFLDEVTTESAAEETQANSFGNKFGSGGSSNGPSGFDKKDGSVFVCINNNNNGGAGGGDDEEDCEDCFDKLGGANLLVLIRALFGGLEVTFEAPIGEKTFNDLGDICDFLIDEATEENLSDLLVTILDAVPGLDIEVTDAEFEALLDCLEDFLFGEAPPTV